MIRMGLGLLSPHQTVDNFLFLKWRILWAVKVSITVQQISQLCEHFFIKLHHRSSAPGVGVFNTCWKMDEKWKHFFLKIPKPKNTQRIVIGKNIQLLWRKSPRVWACFVFLARFIAGQLLTGEIQASKRCNCFLMWESRDLFIWSARCKNASHCFHLLLWANNHLELSTCLDLQHFRWAWNKIFRKWPSIYWNHRFSDFTKVVQD